MNLSRLPYITRPLIAGAALAVTFTALLAPLHAMAQNYPSKPIRLVVPYPAGGPLDQVARLLSEKLRDSLGQPVVVDNKPGAGGNIGADIVAKAPPDGYTMVMGAVATHAINPYLYSKMPYDANKDFTPVTRVATVPNILVMNNETAEKLNLKSVADVILYAKKNPGKLNYASGGNGSAGHLAGELFKTQARVSMVHIAYSGAPPAQLGLLAGQTDLMFDNLASAAPQIKAGKLKAFAVTTGAKSSYFPEIPTLDSFAGMQGFDISTWFGIFLPANTQKAVVDKLHIEIAKALALPDVKERLSRLAADASPLSPEAFTNFVLAEQTKYKKLIPATGARID
jgi:tripartite-type tricarboxylate transporter receptor subunit TctC